MSEIEIIPVAAGTEVNKESCGVFALDWVKVRVSVYYIGLLILIS